MPSSILFPATGKSLANFRRTVISPVRLDDAERFLSNSQAASIRSAHPDGSAAMWGSWTGSDDRFVGKWNRVQPGDRVAFSGKGGLVATATVTHKMRAPSLASHIWNDRVHPDGLFPYELMVTLRDLRDVFIPYDEVRRAIPTWGFNSVVREMNVYDQNEAPSLMTLLGVASIPNTGTTLPSAGPQTIPIEVNSVTSYETQRTDEVRPPALRREAALVDAYATWLQDAGIHPCRHRVPLPEGGDLYTDLFDPSRSELVEAKANASRESIRTGLGQLQDYARRVTHARLALLVPERPIDDLVELLNLHGVGVIWRTGRGFTRSEVV